MKHVTCRCRRCSWCKRQRITSRREVWLWAGIGAVAAAVAAFNLFVS